MKRQKVNSSIAWSESKTSKLKRSIHGTSWWFPSKEWGRYLYWSRATGLPFEMFEVSWCHARYLISYRACGYLIYTPSLMLSRFLLVLKMSVLDIIRKTASFQGFSSVFGERKTRVRAIVSRGGPWMNKWKNEESWMRGQQSCPPTLYFNMWIVSSDVSIQRPHWQPLSVHLWSYCTHPTHDVNDVMCVGFTSPTHFFYVPQQSDKCNCYETGPTVFRPYPRRLESL